MHPRLETNCATCVGKHCCIATNRHAPSTGVTAMVGTRCQFLMSCGGCEIYAEISEIPALDNQCRRYLCHGANIELDTELARHGIVDVDTYENPPEKTLAVAQNSKLVFHLLSAYKRILDCYQGILGEEDFSYYLGRYDEILESLRSENDRGRIATGTILLGETAIQELSRCAMCSDPTHPAISRYLNHAQYFTSIQMTFMSIGVDLTDQDRELIQHYVHVYNHLNVMQRDKAPEEVAAIALGLVAQDIPERGNLTIDDIRAYMQPFLDQIHVRFSSEWIESQVVAQFSHPDKLAIARQTTGSGTDPWYPTEVADFDLFPQK